jgi:hyperosmotically inducible protein
VTRVIKIGLRHGDAAAEGDVDERDDQQDLHGARLRGRAVAHGIDGVKSVKNDLQVVSPGARKMVDAKDADIAKAVETRLSNEGDLKKIDVRADAGVVTLTGQVPTISSSAKASEVARGVNGVRSVKNQLTFTR